MSALPPASRPPRVIAMGLRSAMTGLMHCSKWPSFDHLVGSREQRRWNSQTKSFGRLEIDDQIEFGRLLNGQVGRPLALKDSARVNGRLPAGIRETGSVTHQSAAFDKFSPRVGRRNLMSRCQGNDVITSAVEKCPTKNKKRAWLTLRDCGEGRVEVVIVIHAQR